MAQPNIHQRALCQAETITSQIAESTMLQEVPIIHPKTQDDGVITRPILQKNPKQPADCWKGSHAQLAQPGTESGPGD